MLKAHAALPSNESIASSAVKTSTETGAKVRAADADADAARFIPISYHSSHLLNHTSIAHFFLCRHQMVVVQTQTQRVFIPISYHSSHFHHTSLTLPSHFHHTFL
jgi:hypothetical protein